MLPREAEVRGQIKRELEGAFEKHDSLLSVALEIVDAASWPTKTWPTTDSNTFFMWLGVHARICRSYRAIRFLAEAGLHQELGVLMRSLLELSVAAVFLVRPKVVLLKSRPETDRKLRGDLYLAHFALEQQRMLRKQPEYSSEDDEAKAKEVEFLLGKLPNIWPRRLKGKRVPEGEEKAEKTYSTLNLYDLCKRLGVEVLHQRLYKNFSLASHGADGRLFVEQDDDGNIRPVLEPSSRFIEDSLNLSRVFLLAATAEADTQLKLGFEAQLRAHQADLEQ